MITFLAEEEYLTPPDNEAVPVTKCFFCSETIYAGDEFYKLDGISCCENCLYGNSKYVSYYIFHRHRIILYDYLQLYEKYGTFSMQ